MNENKMTKLYITLDAAFANDGILEKRVPKEYIIKPLEEVIKYMCNHKPDDLNAEISDNPGSCYPVHMMEKAELIEEAMTYALNCDYASIDIHAKKQDGFLVVLGKDKELYRRYLLQFKDEIIYKDIIFGEEINRINLIITGNY